MRRPSLLARLSAASLVAALSLGCADKTYLDFAPDLLPRVNGAEPSPASGSLLQRFYGDEGPGALASSIEAAIQASPADPDLHEIAAYGAILRGDEAAAIRHFLSAAASTKAVAPELYVWEAARLARTVVDHLDAQSLYADLAARHPRPDVRALAAYSLASELYLVGRNEDAAATLATLGFADDWLVIGAFDNDQGKGFATAYEPERAFEPDREQQGMLLPVKWRKAETSPVDKAIPFGEVIAPSDQAVAYAHTYIYAAAAREVELRLTTSTDVKLWVDNKLVVADEKIFHAAFDNVVVRVPLRAGYNRLLIKAANKHGPFRVALRVTEPGGARADGLRVVAKPPSPPTAGARDLTAAVVSPTQTIDKITDKNRRRFLLGRTWTRLGHTHRAAWLYEPALAAAPNNALLETMTALALLENGEAGRAIDLLGKGAARGPVESPAALIARAHFYASRDLLAKAQKDVSAAIERAPRSRSAIMEQASIYQKRGLLIDRCKLLADEVERTPGDALMTSELGDCRSARGYQREAERTLQRARALLPGHVRTLERLFELLDRRSASSDALDLARQLGERDPTSLGALLREAELLRRMGKRDDARATLERARLLSPDSPKPLVALGHLAYEDGKRYEAATSYRLAFERDPDDTYLAERVAALGGAAATPEDKLAPSAADIDAIVRQASKTRIHPGSHTVTLLDDEVTSIRADGSSKRIVTEIHQAVTTDGRDKLTLHKLPSGKVRVTEAYSIKRGERQDASSVGGGQIRFRSLDIGSIVVIQYIHYAGAGRFLPNEYTGTRYFQDVRGQVEKGRWKILLDAGKKLVFSTSRGVNHAEEAFGNGRTLHTFSADASPPLVPEPHMPPAADVLLRASVSTLADYSGYVRWEISLLSDAFGGGDEIEKLAQKLAGSEKTARAKIDKLFAHVSQQIRYQQEYEDSIAGVKPHSARVVMERGYGDCKDKAVFLIRLARAVGVEIRYALLRTTPFGAVDKAVPSQQFNHAIVYVPKQEGIDEGFFLDPTVNGLDLGNLRLDDQGAESLVLDTRTGKWEFLPIPYQSPDLEFVKHKLVVTLDKPGDARGALHVEARGGSGASLRVAQRSPEGAKKTYERIIEQLLAGATLRDQKSLGPEDIHKPAGADLDLDLRGAVSGGDTTRLNVPLPLAIAGHGTLAGRRYPLLLPRGVEELSLELSLPEGQSALHVPGELSVEHTCFAVKRTVKSEGRKVSIRTTARSSCARIEPAEYPAFRAALHKVLVERSDYVTFGAEQKPKRR